MTSDPAVPLRRVLEGPAACGGSGAGCGRRHDRSGESGRPAGRKGSLAGARGGRERPTRVRAQTSRRPVPKNTCEHQRSHPAERSGAPSPEPVREDRPRPPAALLQRQPDHGAFARVPTRQTRWGSSGKCPRGIGTPNELRGSAPDGAPSRSKDGLDERRVTMMPIRLGPGWPCDPGQPRHLSEFLLPYL